MKLQMVRIKAHLRASQIRKPLQAAATGNPQYIFRALSRWNNSSISGLAVIAALYVIKGESEMKRNPVCLAASLVVGLTSSSVAYAADTAPGAPTSIQISRPSDLPAEISIGSSAGPNTEQWDLVWGLQGVRNVSHATLTPFLPSPDNATGTAVIVAPGGAFVYLSIESEGYDVARWLASKGIAAFVLKYRVQPTPRDPKAFTEFALAMAKQIGDPNAPKVEPVTPSDTLADGQAAIRYVRNRASSFGVDPKRIGFLGFSAGAVLTMSVGTAKDPADRPDFIGNIYGSPEARAVPADAPPLFLALALDDPISARGDFGLMNSWRAAKRPVEAHFYQTGGHGFGMHSKGAATALWTEEFHAWLKDRGLLASPDK